MSKFACHTVHAVKYFPAQHDGAANAGAQREHRHVRYVTRRAQPLLTQRGHVAVIIEKELRSQSPLDFLAHRVP